MSCIPSLLYLTVLIKQVRLDIDKGLDCSKTAVMVAAL